MVTIYEQGWFFGWGKQYLIVFLRPKMYFHAWIYCTQNGWMECQAGVSLMPPISTIIACVCWVSIDLNLRVFSGESALTPHTNLTHASRASRHLMPYLPHSNSCLYCITEMVMILWNLLRFLIIINASHLLQFTC